MKLALSSQGAFQGHANPGYWQAVQPQQFLWVPHASLLCLLPTSRTRLTPLPIWVLSSAGTLRAVWAACLTISRDTLPGSTWACMAALPRRAGTASLPLAPTPHCAPQAGIRSVRGIGVGVADAAIQHGCTPYHSPSPSAGGAASTGRLQYVWQGRHQPGAPSVLVRAHDFQVSCPDFPAP